MRFLSFSVVLLVSSMRVDAAAGTDSLDLAARSPLYEGDGGASCSHFLADVLPWERRGGDWRDARGKLHGEQPFAEAAPGTSSTSWDVTGLVRQWAEKGVSRGAFFLRPVSGSGYVKFSSREGKSQSDWPVLILEMDNGRRQVLKPTADTQLDCSTRRSLGTLDALQVSGSVVSLVQFQLPADLSARRLQSAQLVLSSLLAPRGKDLRIGIFEVAVPAFPASPERRGLAADYPADEGIATNSDVVFAAGFEEWLRWVWPWEKNPVGEFDVVSADWDRRFEPLVGKALRVKIKKGAHYGANLRVLLKDHGGEVDELFFRYYLRLGDDWDPTVDGGKLPGLAGTYGKAGWGGRRSDGTNGWALRGGFFRAFPADHPLHGLTQLSTYAYHADMESAYGDPWSWPGALLQRNRWYSIEQQVRLNTPGLADGVLRVWLDGRLLMERQNLRLRTIDALHIETVWLDVYHGGTAQSPYDQHLYIDNVVVARRYIGPMAGRPGGNAGK